MKRTLLITALTSLALATSAQAAVRTLSWHWSAPPQPQSIVPQPSVLDGSEPYFRAVTVAYNDSTGSVTGTLSLYDPPYWQDNLDGQSIQVDLSTACMDEYDLPVPDWATPEPQSDWPNGEYDLKFTLTPEGGAYEGPTGVTGSLSHYRGVVGNQTVAFDGTSYSGTVQSPYFAHRNIRCAYLMFGNGNAYRDSYPGWRWLERFAPPPPPPSHCSSGLVNVTAPSNQCRADVRMTNTWITHNEIKVLFPRHDGTHYATVHGWKLTYRIWHTWSRHEQHPIGHLKVSARRGTARFTFAIPAYA